MDSMWGSSETVTLPELHAAQEALRSYPENTGSFKIRGMRYKIHQSDVTQLQSKGVVTLSAGNAGRAVAFLGQATGLDVKVFMPSTAPDDRKALMEAIGATVVKVAGEQLLESVADCIATEDRVLIHPFDDVDLIRGHASCGLEIIEDAPTADLIVVCCGGGGLLAGVAAAVKLSGSKARVIGVEPEGADSMCLSAAGEAAWCAEGGKTHTIAHGLAPPFAGRACYNHVRQFVDEVVTVTDEEMREATRALFAAGLVSEVSGAAAVAAVLANKVGDVAGKHVVCTVSGRNIEPSEYEHALSRRLMEA